MTERFAGTDRYIATDDLMMAVNAAVTLGRPLLIKGEPGTGKTQLAKSVAEMSGAGRGSVGAGPGSCKGRRQLRPIPRPSFACSLVHLLSGRCETV